jgi:hypothetical protein
MIWRKPLRAGPDRDLEADFQEYSLLPKNFRLVSQRATGMHIPEVEHGLLTVDPCREGACPPCPLDAIRAGILVPM